MRKVGERDFEFEFVGRWVSCGNGESGGGRMEIRAMLRDSEVELLALGQSEGDIFGLEDDFSGSGCGCV